MIDQVQMNSAAGGALDQDLGGGQRVVQHPGQQAGVPTEATDDLPGGAAAVVTEVAGQVVEMRGLDRWDVGGRAVIQGGNLGNAAVEEACLKGVPNGFFDDRRFGTEAGEQGAGGFRACRGAEALQDAVAGRGSCSGGGEGRHLIVRADALTARPVQAAGGAGGEDQVTHNCRHRNWRGTCST
ncbi:hypothetical protein GCM10008957_30090 [Deinococcus ruber]|uniref:Uncharacterized protein n=1 Tax=Deinococcus ruber TaxID=1848197 RepID=A0A918F751_9DEIO|nr:hypothetical protein GCM10008957_30090 [Deinococcus ruber]